MKESSYAIDIKTMDALKTQLDAYGVGVRAGVITPTPEDEDFFREKAGLPKMSSEAKAAWKEDGQVRRPITIAKVGGDESPMSGPVAEE